MCTRIKTNHTEDACHFVALAGIVGALPLHHQNANYYVINCSINLALGGALASPAHPALCGLGATALSRPGCHTGQYVPCLTLNMSAALN